MHLSMPGVICKGLLVTALIAGGQKAGEEWGQADETLIPAVSAGVRTGPSRGAICVLWYNTENLFHPSDDTIAGDDEFTPGGGRHWTLSRYRQKLAKLAKVIIAAGEWIPPDLVGLGEVENGQVLEDLVSHPILEPYRYSYLHRESPDHRGMDVACLFRDQRFKQAGWNTFAPVTAEGFGNTREIVHIWGTWGRRDTLDLFLVHFISRYRGAGSTAGYRKMQSYQLVRLADSVQMARPSSLVVLAGDFNEPWEGYSLEPLRVTPVGNGPVSPVVFNGSGSSYKYRGTWSGIDQFLVARESGRYLITGSVFRHQALLTADETYGGMKPYRTYSGYRYSGGTSDHLPIILHITRPFFSAGSGQ